MAVDKKISELPAAASISTTDISVLVHGGTDFKYAFSLLISFLQSHLTLGCTILFQDATPSAGTGINGDVVIKPATGQFWQKTSGVWTLKYTVPAQGSGNTIIYGATTPNNATGNNGDTFIKTDGGIFYQKVTGAWVVKFTMASGPAGATGAAGTPGTNGTNGKTILNGNIPPSNIDDGVNGDFYLNNSNYDFYGPKTGGVWGDPVSLIGPAFDPPLENIVITTGSTYPIFLSIADYSEMNHNASLDYYSPQLDISGIVIPNTLKRRFDCFEVKTYTNLDDPTSFLGWDIYGPTIDSATTNEDLYITMKK